MIRVIKGRKSSIVILASVTLLLAIITGCEKDNSVPAVTNEQSNTTNQAPNDTNKGSSTTTDHSSTTSSSDENSFTEDQIQQAIQVAMNYKKDQYTVGQEYKQTTSPEAMQALQTKRIKSYVTEEQLNYQILTRTINIPVQLAAQQQSTLSPQDFEIQKKEPQTKQGVLQLSYKMNLAFANGQPSIPVEGELQLEPTGDTWKVSYDTFNNKELKEILSAGSQS